MPAVFLPTYSAKFLPSKGISSGSEFSGYWEELQERVGKIFGSAHIKGLPADESAVIYNFSGFTPGRDIYAAGTFFRAKKPPANSSGLWVAQYDVAACSFDEDYIRRVEKEFGLPMGNVRKAGDSEILFPVLIGCELAVARDRNVSMGLEAELLSTAVA